MIFLAKAGERVRAAMALTTTQETQTVSEYEASRCSKCGVPGELHERVSGALTCVTCDGGPNMIRFSYCVHSDGPLDQEETLIRASSRVDADRQAEERAAAWNCRLQFVGVRDGYRLAVRIPVEQLPESWRDELPKKAGGWR